MDNLQNKIQVLAALKLSICMIDVHGIQRLML